MKRDREKERLSIVVRKRRTKRVEEEERQIERDIERHREADRGRQQQTEATERGIVMQRGARRDIER